jgi:hypothetical protein
MSAKGAAPRAHTVVFTIPPLCEQPHVFRRELLNAIRLAISSAQVAGTIDTAVAVECLKALPIAEPPR